MTIALPPQMHVFVRDWLSANNLLLKSRDGHVLIDTGYGRHVPLTLGLLASPHGVGREPLAWVVNTHGHSDHIGGNAALARRFRCQIAVPEGEWSAIERWDTTALLLDYADQHAERFVPHDALQPGATRVWGDLEWRLLAAPGHDNGALVFYNAEHRLLVSGDALWQHGFGFVMPPDVDPTALSNTRATIDMLAQLDVRTVIPGHGEPFTEVGRALERAMRRVEAFEEDPARMVRHAMKVVFTFALLDRRRMRCEDLPAYLDRVGIYRDFNRRFLRLSAMDFAEWLAGSLEEAGALRREDGWLLAN